MTCACRCTPLYACHVAFLTSHQHICASHQHVLPRQELDASPRHLAGSGPKHVSVQFNMVTCHGCAGGPSGWGNSAFAASMAQVESAVEAAEMKAPSRWRTAEAIAAVHLWSPMVRHTAVHGLLWHGAGS